LLLNFTHDIQTSADKAYLYAVDFREWTYKSSLVPFAKAGEREGGGESAKNTLHKSCTSKLMEQCAIKIRPYCP